MKIALVLLWLGVAGILVSAVWRYQRGDPLIQVGYTVGIALMFAGFGAAVL